MRRRGQAAALQNLQHQALESIASGHPLKTVMERLCREVERMAPEVIVSVLAVDGDGRIAHLASPSLPAAYAQAIDGLQIGPGAGSCGTAAYRGEAVEVTDIATDPLWTDFRALALPIGLRACWSTPIKTADGRVVGTFAFYARTPRRPTALERAVAARCVHLCAIAIEHETTQAHIRDLAFRDALTGLRNRTCFHKFAAEMLAARQDGEALAIHCIDLDDFKGVNDALGHWVGDRLLEQVAARLATCAQEGDLLARLDGDEFALVQRRAGDAAEVGERARRLTALFDQPFKIEHHTLRTGASVGVVQVPQDGEELTDLVNKADLALYRVKAEQPGSYRLFTAELYERVQARRTLECDLRKAIAAGEFELFYQPIVSLDTGAILGAEALVRWNHPTRGLLAPSAFIPVAEETGLIGGLGEWILRTACRQAAAWPPHAKVAVNLSPLQLDKPFFVFDVVRSLAAAGLSPYRLELEITETVPLTEDARLRTTLHELKALGVGISLDDFGTGYSSLSYLRAFPFDRIKIDRSFIGDLHQGSHASSIVHAVIGLARDLGARITAEGIEDAAQLAWLKREGCNEGQGYYFSVPLRAAVIAELLERTVPGTRFPAAAARLAAPMPGLA